MKVKLTKDVFEGNSKTNLKVTVRQGRPAVAWTQGTVIEASEATAQKLIEQGVAEPTEEQEADAEQQQPVEGQESQPVEGQEAEPVQEQQDDEGEAPQGQAGAQPPQTEDAGAGAVPPDQAPGTPADASGRVVRRRAGGNPGR